MFQLHLQSICLPGGTIKIHSTNPFDVPLIDPNMLNTDFDITAMRESVKATKRFAAAPAWSDYVIGPFGNLSATADADIDAYVRQLTTTIFHPAGTASMAPFNSTNGVVNPDFTVKGTEGLRIVDLSVVVSTFFYRYIGWCADNGFATKPAFHTCLPPSRPSLLDCGEGF